jgi:hypothetical protein
MQNLTRVKGRHLLHNVLRVNPLNRSGRVGYRRRQINDLVNQARSYLQSPDHRVITAHLTFNFDGTPDGWVYYSDDHFTNLLPFLISQLATTEKAQLLANFHPAPELDDDSYPFFNYDVDTLYLHYGRCGGEKAEHKQYFDALNEAIEAIAEFEARHPNIPGVQHLQVTYCPQMANKFSGRFTAFVNMFSPLTHLRDLTVVNHATGKHMWSDRTLVFEDAPGDDELFRECDEELEEFGNSAYEVSIAEYY